MPDRPAFVSEQEARMTADALAELAAARELTREHQAAMQCAQYRVTAEDVQVTQKITEAQFRRIGELTDQSLGRFKGWSEWYSFDVDTETQCESLAAYLRSEGIAHVVTTERTWTA